MKTFIGAMAALLVIIIGIQIYIDVLDDTVSTMEESIEEIISAAGENDWENCQKALEHFQLHWKDAKKWFAVFIHHDEMDLIHEALYEIEIYIQYQDRVQTCAKANVLKILLEHIPENERLTLENVL